MKKLITYLLIILSISSCELTEVLDQDPPHNLVPGNVVKNEAGAENLLRGAYAQFHSQYYYIFTELVPGLLSGTMANAGFLADAAFATNDVTQQNTNLNQYWTTIYQLINHANGVLELVDPLSSEAFAAGRKSSLLAEAHALRALGHFQVLRYFGQFYDLESPLGVVIQRRLADFVTRNKARSTVAEGYQFILDDLDIAIQDAPDFSSPYYFSKIGAKALKARVLLFMGRYDEAADLADEVIQSGKRSLDPSFADVFSRGSASTGMILMRATDAVTAANNERKRFTYGGASGAIASPSFRARIAGDPRASATYFSSNNRIRKLHTTEHFSPTYFIRLAEMYLIKAEGLARSGAPLEDAKEPLEVVRTRAFGSPQTSDAASLDELLEEIYEEYILELAFENGSDWFAMIRFNKIFDEKPTVTSINQLILPIPEAELLGNSLFGSQNPGYE